MKVVATKEYEERNIQDNQLLRIPKEGEVFEVSEERFNVLSGKNSYGVVFVEEYKEDEQTTEDTEDTEEQTTEGTEEDKDKPKDVPAKENKAVLVGKNKDVKKSVL